jgi:HAE1 family hydrophobic/amphiphilic exporter-1
MANFIQRPIVAMVIAVLMSSSRDLHARLPTAQLESHPRDSGEATYTGADAETIEQSVATPIEQQMSGVTT